MASTRPEFSLLDLPHEQLNQLLRMQFAAQQREYRSAYPGSEQSIVSFKDAAVGHLWVARKDSEIHVLDISLLPEFRRLGIGSVLYRQLLAEGKAKGQAVRCSVSRFNEASLQFHRRLGFRTIAETDVMLAMEFTS